MTAYDRAARTYQQVGWQPIPVHGKSVPAKGTTGYDGTVTPAKVDTWLGDDHTARARTGRGVGMDNIGIRHHLTLAIDVDHGYGDKNGVEQLAAYAQRAGLPPLPATWSSTARGVDSPSRQYVYRIPEDVPFKTKPCKSVELCTWHHRFTVCAPTIHPGTSTPYLWYMPGEDGVPPTWGDASRGIPTLDHLAELPTAWFEALRGGTVNADKTAAVVDLPDLFATFPDGDPGPLVRHLIQKWTDEHVGHDEFKNAGIQALMLGREGHTGVRALWNLLVDRYTSYLAAARPDAADAEVRSLVAAVTTIAQQKPITPKTDLAGLIPQPTTADPLDDPAAATTEELQMFLDTYTRYTRPDRLGRRAAWMKNDPPSRLGWHARHLVAGALAGHYPADKALDALTDACKHHGGTNPSAPHQILSVALGTTLAALNARSAA